MPGEDASDDPPEDSLKRFEVETYNMIMDRAIQSLENRFSKHQELYTGIACFDTHNFDDIVSGKFTVPANALDKVTLLLQQFFPQLDATNLKDELISFAKHWSSLKVGLPDAFQIKGSSGSAEDDTFMEEDESVENVDHVNNLCRKNCKNCIVCAYALLLRFNLYTRAYPTLFVAYKLLLTIGVTQVACERSFSKLKLIKTKSRNSMCQEHLEAFMLMFTEKDILLKLDHDQIIDIVACKSSELKRLLLIN